MKFHHLIAAVALVAISGGAVQAATVTSLVGDKDVFGLDTDGDGFPNSRPGATSPGDPAGFDVYMGGEATKVRNWTHQFVLPVGETIVSAMLTIMTGEMEDGGGTEGTSTHDGSAVDDTLTLDGTEYAGAFDTVTGYFPDIYPQESVFDLTGWIPSLYDGTLNVILNPSAGSIKDYIAVDWAELTIVTEAPTTDAAPVPLPASALLLMGGMGGMAALRRRKRG